MNDCDAIDLEYLDDGVVKRINLEQPGKFEVSDAMTMLGQLG